MFIFAAMLAFIMHIGEKPAKSIRLGNYENTQHALWALLELMSESKVDPSPS